MTNRAEKAAFALVAELAVGGASPDEALRKFGILGEHAVPALRDALQLAERPLVLLAAQALAKIESRKVIAPLLNVAHARRERDAEIVAIALHGVAANLRDDDTDRLLPFALEFRDHPDSFVRAGVAAIMGALEPERTHDELALLARDCDQHVAETAAAQIRLNGQGGDDLLGRLADPRGDVRLGAIRELLSRDDADNVILQHLETSLPKLRRTLLEAAAQQQSPTLASALLALIERAETSDHDRALCLRGVVSTPTLDLEALGRTAHRFSQVADVFVRAEAFAMGIRCKVPYADELIERALRDPDEHVQEAAAAAATDLPAHQAERTAAPALEPAPSVPARLPTTSLDAPAPAPPATLDAPAPAPPAALDAPAPASPAALDAHVPAPPAAAEDAFVPPFPNLVSPAAADSTPDNSRPEVSGPETPPASALPEHAPTSSATLERRNGESFAAFAARESHVVPKAANDSVGAPVATDHAPTESSEGAAPFDEAKDAVNTPTTDAQPVEGQGPTS